MEIREATRSDVPAIVTLLKQSLGESLMPKSEEYWRWKHIDNPFGASPVLLAWDGSKLVGVRAFMRWRWKLGTSTREAVRAVDTATHPDYQGKGIFSKLTKASLETCKERGWHFVFNTPNDKSKPGYLKMGWIEAGKLPLNIGIKRPFDIFLNTVLKRSVHIENNENNLGTFFNKPGLEKVINARESNKTIFTDHSVQSLIWRYKDVPVADYSGVAIMEEQIKALLVYRLKSSRAGTEFRIVDFFSESSEHSKQLIEKLKIRINELNVDYVTSSAFNSSELIKGGLSLKNIKLGPTVTVRNISLPDLNAFIGFSAWSPTLGDLELF
jgi:N-acetylglutamate synthase-like GNAT family acetyltransferase